MAAPNTQGRGRLWPLSLAAIVLVLVAGCAGTPKQARSPAAIKAVRAGPGSPHLPPAGSGRGGYYQDDGPGEKSPQDLDQVGDAVPRAEPYSKRGNRPYVVFGKTYTPRTDERPFVQRGKGSWYGKKFHGQRTASGELYDMYKMTAAHPTLPIPSYARITSVDSGKQVIVRINDRGPFHSKRIVDVSYTAALKLGMLEKGSHEVELERLLPSDIERLGQSQQRAPVALSQPVSGPELASRRPVAMDMEALMQNDAIPIAVDLSAPSADPAEQSGFYLQLGAYASADKAEAERAKLHQHAGVLAPLTVVAGPLHRLYSGPFQSRANAAKALQALPAALSAKPIIVER